MNEHVIHGEMNVQWYACMIKIQQSQNQSNSIVQIHCGASSSYESRQLILHLSIQQIIIQTKWHPTKPQKMKYDAPRSGTDSPTCHYPYVRFQ